MLKAIQTPYKGYNFRSRLEARWAVFFDALGLKWEYEPEGFELPGGFRYLPDFKVDYPDSGFTQTWWFEVKSSLDAISPNEWGKLLAFERANSQFLILDGVPEVKMYNGAIVAVLGCMENEDDPLPNPIRSAANASSPARGGWLLWSYKERPWADAYTNVFPLSRGQGHYFDDTLNTDLQWACDKARSARFEHGQSGATR